MPLSKQKQQLTDHLRAGSVDTFIQFLGVLLEEKRSDIVTDVFNLNVGKVEQERSMFYSSFTICFWNI